LVWHWFSKDAMRRPIFAAVALWPQNLGARLGKMRYPLPFSRTLLGPLVGLAALLLSACQDFGQPGSSRFPFFPGASRHVQAGEVAVRDGSEVQVCYPIPFQSPPRLTFTISQSYFRDKPFHESDFEIVKQDATCFTVSNNHTEMNRNSWAVVKWRAE